MIRSYFDLAELNTFQERFDYLKLSGSVADPTFGSERYINQRFYRSFEWKQVRNYVIARDEGCDLAFPGHEIFDKIIIHHMNPMTPEEIVHGDEAILDPEFLISTSHATHNAIHYGNEDHLPRFFAEREPGDTKLW